MIEIISGLILGVAFGCLLSSNHILRKRLEILQREVKFLEWDISFIRNKVISKGPVMIPPWASEDMRKCLENYYEQIKSINGDHEENLRKMFDESIESFNEYMHTIFKENQND